MKQQRHPRKIIHVIYIVTAALCLLLMVFTMLWMREQLYDAESLVATYKRDFVDEQKANATLQANNIELQRRNDELQDTNSNLSKALSAYDYDFSIDADAPPRYLNVHVDKDLQDYIWSLCCLYGIDDQYEMIYAIMRQESNFDSTAVSSTDDYGLMQINVVNHRSLSKTLGITDFLDPYQNVHAGIYMFANALHKYGNASDALMTYNMGDYGASKLWSQGIHSTGYSRSVLAYYEQFIEDI